MSHNRLLDAGAAILTRGLSEAASASPPTALSLFDVTGNGVTFPGVSSIGAYCEAQSHSP